MMCVARPDLLDALHASIQVQLELLQHHRSHARSKYRVWLATLKTLKTPPCWVQAMVGAWEAGCGKLDQYGMQYTRLFANLCNAGAHPAPTCVSQPPASVHSPAFGMCASFTHAPLLWELCYCGDVVF